MQIASTPKSRPFPFGASSRWFSCLGLALLLSSCSSGPIAMQLAKVPLKSPSQAGASAKTESVQGEPVGAPVDCDGDGLSNESQLDFDGDGVSDECVEGGEAIPEPPFQQSYIPTSEAFDSLLPVVGWNARYQCGDNLYEVSLRRPTADRIEYSAEGLTLSSEIVYDDLDPNLNQPLIIREPATGIRYTFTQQADGEFYEYAIADYSGNVGLYVYQTGEQIVAAPCESMASEATALPAIAPSAG
ncbi:MAG: hypothetical protein AAFN40_13770 [Cyanobacteria bacterium J06560_6]